MVLAGTLKFIRMWSYPFERKASSHIQNFIRYISKKTLVVVEGEGRGGEGGVAVHIPKGLLYIYSRSIVQCLELSAWPIY